MTTHGSSDLADSAESVAAEKAAIELAVLDYFEGWFEGDVERMERALHPELAKRSPQIDEAGAETLAATTAQEMIDATKEGVGRSRGEGDRRIEVRVEDVYRAIANVTVRSTVYREYVQLARTRDGWKIVNALWART